jgi:hypothetical protein
MADVSRVTGPLGPFAAGFVDHLSRQGFKPETVGRHVALVAGFSNWLAAEGVAPSGLSSEVAERYAAARRAAGHSNRLTIKALEPLLAHQTRSSDSSTHCDDVAPVSRRSRSNGASRGTGTERFALLAGSGSAGSSSLRPASPRARVSGRRC